jgi:hypothetical protein
MIREETQLVLCDSADYQGAPKLGTSRVLVGVLHQHPMLYSSLKCSQIEHLPLGPQDDVCAEGARTNPLEQNKETL